MQKQHPKQAFGPAVNRIRDLMAHSDSYAFMGVSRLAADAQISASTLSKILNGRECPSCLMVERLRAALEREFRMPLDTRDLIAENGCFKTPHVCDVVPCKGCLPANAHDEFGHLKPTFQDVRPGTWVTSRYPKGYRSNAYKEV